MAVHYFPGGRPVDEDGPVEPVTLTRRQRAASYPLWTESVGHYCDILETALGRENIIDHIREIVEVGDHAAHYLEVSYPENPERMGYVDRWKDLHEKARKRIKSNSKKNGAA